MTAGDAALRHAGRDCNGAVEGAQKALALARSSAYNAGRDGRCSPPPRAPRVPRHAHGARFRYENLGAV